MNRLLFVLLALLVTPLRAQLTAEPALAGRVEDQSYVSPTGAFRVRIPVLPELGGTIRDTGNVVIFQDDFNVLCTIAVFPMDATQRWEYSTRGPKDYLAYFFGHFVMPDFQDTFPGSRVESARFAAGISDGALFTYTILPNGSMFNHKLAFIGPGEALPDAKRGNMLFVRHGWVYVLSVELAERVLERSSYNKTPEEEDRILRERLVALHDRIEFTAPTDAAK